MIGLSLLREKTWWWESKPMDMCQIEGPWGYYFVYQKLLQTRAQDASNIFFDFLSVKIGFDDVWIADLKSQRCWWNGVFCGNHNRIIQSHFFFSDFFRMWPSKNTKTNLNKQSVLFFCITQVHETGSTNDTTTHHWLFEIWLIWLVGDLMCHCPNCPTPPPSFSFYYTGFLTMAFFSLQKSGFSNISFFWSTVIHDFRKLPNFEPRPWNMLNIWWCNCTRRPWKLLQLSSLYKFVDFVWGI